MDNRVKCDYDRAGVLHDMSADNGKSEGGLLEIGQTIKCEDRVIDSEYCDKKAIDGLYGIEASVELQDPNKTDSVNSVDDSVSPSSVRSTNNQGPVSQHSPIYSSPMTHTTEKSPASPLTKSDGHTNDSSDTQRSKSLRVGVDTGQSSAGSSPTSCTTSQIQQHFENKYLSSVSSDFCQSGSNQGSSIAKPRISPRENTLAVTDSFYQTPGSETNFPVGNNQFANRGMVNGGYNLMDNYSQGFPDGSRVSHTSKDNLSETFGQQQGSALKSNQLSPLEKLNALQLPQKRYPYATENSSRGDNGYKCGNFNSPYHYTSNFDMNSNTYHSARGFSGYNNRIHGENIDLQGPVSMDEFGSNNRQLKPGSLTSGQLNAYQNGIYYESNYGVGYNAGVNRTMSSSILSQQNYLNTTQHQHASNMVENNGNFEQFSHSEGQYNSGTGSEFSSMFAEFYNYTPQGFPTT